MSHRILTIGPGAAADTYYPIKPVFTDNVATFQGTLVAAESIFAGGKRNGIIRAIWMQNDAKSTPALVRIVSEIGTRTMLTFLGIRNNQISHLFGPDGFITPGGFRIGVIGADCEGLTITYDVTEG